MKKVLIFSILFFSVTALFSIAFFNNAYSQTEKQAIIESINTPFDKSAIKTLRSLIKNREAIETQIKKQRKLLKSTKPQEDKNTIIKELEKLKSMLKENKQDFEKVAAGPGIKIYDKMAQEKFEWKDEINTLLLPLIQELKKMTDRPRQIEKFRNEIFFYEQQLDLLIKANEHVNQVVEQTGPDDKKLEENLISLKQTWADKEKHISGNLRVVSHQLKELQKQKQSVWTSFQNILQGFFKSRGRNFCFAILSFFIVFFILRAIHSLIHKYSPMHKERTFSTRIMDVAYHFLTVIGSISALIFVLYLSGDWLLLSFAIIFLLGLAWTAKEGLPRSWKHIQIMLNLGMVRENERIVYNGVPWKVDSLNVYAKLKNPALQPSEIRLPLKEILDMNSRPYHKDEPWFPCYIDDWVILGDGTRGKIISQTAEMVRMVLRGGAQKTYNTQDFLGLSPMNLSCDFRLKVYFGFDYAHQAIITDKIPGKLREAIIKGLDESGYSSDVKKLQVDIQAAGASSLDLVIIADISGRIASLYGRLQRVFQRLTIEACTANNWGIPFPQITVHTPDRQND